MSACDPPAPSEVINRSPRRWVGTCAIAWRSTSIRSAAVFDPAPPGRGINAASSLLLSVHTPRLWNPNDFLKVPSACCFPEWARVIVPSTRSTMVVPMLIPPA